MATELWMENDGLHVKDGVEYVYEDAYVKSITFHMECNDDSVKIEKFNLKTSPLNEIPVIPRLSNTSQ